MGSKSKVTGSQPPATGSGYGRETGCPAECLPDLIRKHAYQLYEARGYQPGREQEDWLEAEREIKHRFNL